MVKVEFKKFIQPIVIGVVCLISFVSYQYYISFIYTFWPNGGITEFYNFSHDWHDRFGLSMSDADFEVVANENQERVKKADSIIKESEYGKQRGINTYKEFKTYESELPEGSILELPKSDQKERQELRAFIQSNEKVFSQIETFETIIKEKQSFSSPEVFVKGREINQKEQEKLTKVLFQNDSWRNILPMYLPDTLASRISDMLITILIALGLLIPFVFVKDTMLKIKATQWSSKRGRNIVKSQYIATQLWSLMTITVMLGVFLYPLKNTEFTRYFSSGLNSFLGESWFQGRNYSFLEITFGSWLCLVILLVYLVGMSFSHILFFIGQTSRNYLNMLMKVIPMLTVFIILSSLIFNYAFYLENKIYQWTGIVNSELYVSLLLLIASVGIGITPIFMSKKRELI